MKYDPQRHHRRSIRLRGFDYTQAGAYFVTVVAQQRARLFGDVVDGEMRSNDAGRVVAYTWHDLPNHVGGITLDAFVVMPNHVHGIIIITDNVYVGAGSVGAGSEPAPTMEPAPTEPTHKKRHALPEIVRQFKTFSARRINQLRGTPGTVVWQRNYYEHIIRNQAALERIRAYIAHNPRRWDSDRENLHRC